VCLLVIGLLVKPFKGTYLLFSGFLHIGIVWQFQEGRSVVGRCLGWSLIHHKRFTAIRAKQAGLMDSLATIGTVVDFHGA